MSSDYIVVFNGFIDEFETFDSVIKQIDQDLFQLGILVSTMDYQSIIARDRLEDNVNTLGWLHLHAESLLTDNLTIIWPIEKNIRIMNRTITALQMSGWVKKIHIKVKRYLSDPLKDPEEQLLFIRELAELLHILNKVLAGTTEFAGYPYIPPTPGIEYVTNAT